MPRFVSPILALIVVAGTILLQASEPALIGTLRNAVFDAYQRWQPRQYQPAPVRVVDIDEV